MPILDAMCAGDEQRSVTVKMPNSNENNRTINSSDFDERLFREYYSYPFFKGVTEGGSRAFMTAYNKYNP